MTQLSRIVRPLSTYRREGRRIEWAGIRRLRLFARAFFLVLAGTSESRHSMAYLTRHFGN